MKSIQREVNYTPRHTELLERPRWILRYPHNNSLITLKQPELAYDEYYQLIDVVTHSSSIPNCLSVAVEQELVMKRVLRDQDINTCTSGM